VATIRRVDRPLRLTAELELDGTSVNGLARDGHGNAIAFTGWLGLIGAVDQLRDRTGLPSSPTEPRPDPEETP
jgi:hypothetical protein